MAFSAAVLPLALSLAPQVAERAVEPGTGRVVLRSDAPLTFHEADALARLAGGALVSIGSAEEENFLLENFAAEEGYWIGLEFPREAWSSGRAITFTHWFRGEPNGGAREPFTVWNYGEPGGWGDIAGEPEKERYRALIEFEPGRAPERLPALPEQPMKRGVLLLAVEDLTARDLENPRLPNLSELWQRAAWSTDAEAEGDPLASLGALVWGVGAARSRLTLARPKDADLQGQENLLARLERGLSRISSAALFDDQAASGILMDGRVDLRVANASARKGGSAKAVGEALALTTPLCLVAIWTNFAVAGAEPAAEAQRQKELAAIDAELGLLLAALRARSDYASEDWLIALAGLVPPAGKAQAKKPSPEDLRQRTSVPLGLVASTLAPRELLGEIALVDLVPSALSHLGLEPRRSMGLDGRVLALERPPALGQDLLANGGAEAQYGYAGAGAHLAGWRNLGGFRVVPWPANLAGDPGPAARGRNCFQGSAGARLEQTLDLTALAAEIDRGVVRFELGALLGLARDTADAIEVVATSLNERKRPLEERVLALPEAPKKDQGQRRAGWTPLTLAGRLPRRTRALRIALVGTGPEVLADELRLTLARD
jgi:hypothetical protein